MTSPWGFKSVARAVRFPRHSHQALRGRPRGFKSVSNLSTCSEQGERCVEVSEGGLCRGFCGFQPTTTHDFPHPEARGRRQAVGRRSRQLLSSAAEYPARPMRSAWEPRRSPSRCSGSPFRPSTRPRLPNVEDAPLQPRLAFARKCTSATPRRRDVRVLGRTVAEFGLVVTHSPDDTAVLVDPDPNRQLPRRDQWVGPPHGSRLKGDPLCAKRGIVRQPCEARPYGDIRESTKHRDGRSRFTVNDK